MTSRPLAEIVCVIDRSGSMNAIKSDAIGGFNSFLADQKKLDGSANLTLVLFDHEYDLLINGVDINMVAPLTEDTYRPRGTTALLDAIGRTLDDLAQRLERTPQKKQPDQVMVAILTDGMENASCDYTRDRVFEKIQYLQKQRDWQFIFLAANQDAIQTGAELGIAHDRSVSFDSSGVGVKEAFSVLACMTAEVRGKVKKKK